MTTSTDDRRNKIERGQIHAALWCVYDPDGYLLAAFVSRDAAETYSAEQMYGPEL